MGTEFKACLEADPGRRLDATQDIQLGFKKLHDINSWMSDWVEGTELNQINAAAGIHPVKIGKPLLDLLIYSQDVSKKTSGAYDPTFNVFFGLYNFKPGQEREPTDEEIKERLPLINYKNLVLNTKDSTAYLKKVGMKLGLGAIGQGYGVDQLVSEFKAKKYYAGYVDGSGDTYFWGKKADGSLWTTGIRDPFNKERVLAKFYGTDVAITTSGDDEKFFMKDGRRVHHIIDTKTGRPADKMRQVTVIAPLALDADAYDTSCFILGTKDCLLLLKKLNLQAVMVETSGKIVMTPGVITKKDRWGEYITIK